MRYVLPSSYAMRGVWTMSYAALSLPIARGKSFPSRSSRPSRNAARAAFREGLELREGNDLPRAIGRLKAAYDIVQTPRIAYELGRTYRMAKSYIAARETFLEVERLPVRPQESAEARAARMDARTQAAELETKIPTV